MIGSRPKMKWERQLTPYRIMTDIIWADLDGSRKPRIILATSDDGELHCINGDGSEEWSFKPGKRFASNISVGQPMVDDPGKLVIAVARGRNIFAIDPRGAVAWRRSFPAFCIFGGPTIAGPPGSQMILYGGDGERLFCLDLEGNLLWYFSASGPIEDAPAVGDVDGDGRTEIFFGSQDAYLYSLRDDGSLRWRYKTRSVGDGIACGPILADVDGDGRIEVVCGSWDRHVYCLAAKDGELKWEIELKGGIRNGLVISDINCDGKQEIMAGDIYGLACLSCDGDVIWDYTSGGEEMVVAASPVVGDVTGDGKPNIVFGTQTGALYALDAEGQLEWMIPLGKEEIVASPLLADVDDDGYLEVVFGTSQGRVVCLETPAPSQPGPLWPMGRRRATQNPGLVPPGLGRGAKQTITLGKVVAGPEIFDGGFTIDVEREVVSDLGHRIWWECKKDQPTLDDASPLSLFLESKNPDRPVRGILVISVSQDSKTPHTLKVDLKTPSGSVAIDLHLGEFIDVAEGLRIGLKYEPEDGNPVVGPALELRRIARRPLLKRITEIRKELRLLDKDPRTPEEDLTRDLIHKCLEYAEIDAKGDSLGRAEVMISEIEEQIRKHGYAWDGPVKPPSKRVGINEEGIVCVDGRPFFPLGFYNIHDAEDVRKLTSLGFNTTFNLGDEKFMDACDETGMMAIGHGPGENMQNFSSLNHIRKRMEEIYWQPSLLAWYVVDEPALREVPVDVIRRASTLVKMVDPNHLTLICEGGPYRGRPYQSLADIASPAYYPIWKQMSMTTVARCVDDTVASVPENQPVWFVVQAFTWRGIRFPTPEEERCMTYLAIIHGARGISWYAYKYPHDEVLQSVYDHSPELWREILRIVKEVKELEPMLLGPRVPVHIWECGGARVDWCMIEREGKVLIIACNPTKNEALCAFKVGLPDLDLAVLWEDRLVHVTKGVFVDKVPPRSVRAYRGGVHSSDVT